MFMSSSFFSTSVAWSARQTCKQVDLFDVTTGFPLLSYTRLGWFWLQIHNVENGASIRREGMYRYRDMYVCMYKQSSWPRGYMQSVLLLGLRHGTLILQNYELILLDVCQ